MARMKRWEIIKNDEIMCLHQRRSGTANTNVLFSVFRDGVMDYSIGFHPLYMLVKVIYRVKEKPYFLSSIFRLSGYLFAFFKRKPKVLPVEVVTYIRKEQMLRLRKVILKKCKVF